MAYTLFIDESGESFPGRYKASPYFIVCGCSINQDKRDFASRSLDQIKFKYWDAINIVFRSCEIGRKEKNFAIFRNNLSLFRDFTQKLNSFLSSCPLVLLGVIVDQENAFRQNWTQKTVIRKSYNALFANFIRLLSAQNNKGEIIQEASTPIQDITIYETFLDYQTRGIPSENISDKEVKERLTALSFVTKRHMDTESQLADLLSYGLKLEYRIRHKAISLESLNGYEKMAREQARKKLYEVSTNITSKKKSRYQNFQSLTILP